MKVLLFGASGQVGRELTLALQDEPQVELLTVVRAQADLLDVKAVHDAVIKSRADAVINAAAYTAVDQAESNADTAMMINGAAPAAIAEACRQIDARLIHHADSSPAITVPDYPIPSLQFILPVHSPRRNAV